VEVKFAKRFTRRGLAFGNWPKNIAIYLEKFIRWKIGAGYN